jgi:hypothetical protein
VNNCFRNAAFAVSGRFHAPIPLPFTPSYGIWNLLTMEEGSGMQHGAELRPTRAPWRDLFAALDESASRTLTDPVTPWEEAAAIVACCWRYGSYAHVLTAGELYPPFRRDRFLCRISNSEMMRINLEFSSGLAVWLMQRVEEPKAIRRRVRAALELIPMPWRELQPVIESQRADGLVALARDWVRSHGHELSGNPLTPREEANRVVFWAYRAGPVEDLNS